MSEQPPGKGPAKSTITIPGTKIKLPRWAILVMGGGVAAALFFLKPGKAEEDLSLSEGLLAEQNAQKEKDALASDLEDVSSKLPEIPIPDMSIPDMSIPPISDIPMTDVAGEPPYFPGEVPWSSGEAVPSVEAAQEVASLAGQTAPGAPGSSLPPFQPGLLVGAALPALARTLAPGAPPSLVTGAAPYLFPGGAPQSVGLVVGGVAQVISQALAKLKQQQQAQAGQLAKLAEVKKKQAQAALSVKAAEVAAKQAQAALLVRAKQAQAVAVWQAQAVAVSQAKAAAQAKKAAQAAKSKKKK